MTDARELDITYRYCYVIAPTPDGDFCVECGTHTYEINKHDTWHASAQRHIAKRRGGTA